MPDVGQNPTNRGRAVKAEARRRGNEDALGRLAALLESNEIDLADVGDVRQIRVNEWDVVTKDDNGRPEVTKAKAASIVLSPAWESGPKWDLVRPAALTPGRRAREVLCRSCLTQLPAILNGQPATGNSAKPATDGTGHAEDSPAPTRRTRRNVSGGQPSAATGSPSTPTRPLSVAKADGAASVEPTSPAPDASPGASTTITPAVPVASALAAGVCVVCSAPTATFISGTGKRSAPTPAAKLSSGWSTAVILPDPQIGYRHLPDGTLDPFHDPDAMSVAVQIVEAERPALVVHLGDLLDLASMSHYRQEAAFALTVQPTLDRAYEYLATIAALAGESRLLEGNHDARLSNYILDNAVAAFGLRRAGTTPSDWPVMSVPNLLHLDELGVEYIGGYPSGATYLNDELCCIHGRIVRSSKSSTAAAVAVEERTSVIFGHIHRHELQSRTFNRRGGYHQIIAASPGCLCRIDGSVPSVKSGAHPTGRPVRSWEDWTQGLAVVHYHEDGRFAYNPIFIHEGRALWGGQEFSANVQ